MNKAPFEECMNPFAWELIEHIAVTAAVLVVGIALQKSIGRGSERRRVHGTFVLWWCVACYFAGWFVALLDGADSALGRSGGAWFGLLVGWLGSV
jgi:hypothetical protein